MLGDGTLRRYIDELSITGLTSNPTIFDKAISAGGAYDEQIVELTSEAWSPSRRSSSWRWRTSRRGANVRAGQRAHRRRRRLGLARGLAAARRRRHRRRSRRSPSCTPERTATSSSRSRARTRGARRSRSRSSPAPPINVTLLFSTEQYLGAAEAYMRGVERRIEAGLDPAVPSVASIFVSRWDVAVADQVSQELRNRLGIAVAKQSYGAYRELLDSERWQRLANEGARPQRLLFASTGTKDPERPRHPLHRGARGAPSPSTRCPTAPCSRSPTTERSREPIPADGGDAEQVLAEFEAAGVDVAELAARLQREGGGDVRQVVEGAHAVDRREEPRAGGGRVRWAGSIPSPRPDRGKEPRQCNSA